MKNTTEVIAPARIDFAGGTLDIWPLYLYFDESYTINLAVSIYANTKIDIRNDKKIVIVSIDMNKTMEFDSISALTHDHTLNLITELISFFKPQVGLTVESCSEAPAGAGLAGSSALNISLCYALNNLTGKGYNNIQLQLIAKNIEARVLNVPTGEQDYFSAIYGGLNSISFTAEGIKRIPIKTDLKKLYKRIVIAYSGDSRNSGVNNWEIYKSVIDGDKKVIGSLKRIAKTSCLMNTALQENDFDAVGNLIEEEWENRKLLWKDVSTSRIDETISIGIRNGAMSAKVCGAGGGGCILFYARCGEVDKLEAEL